MATKASSQEVRKESTPFNSFPLSRAASCIDKGAAYFINSEEVQGKGKPRPPESFGEYCGALLSSADARDTLLKLTERSVKFSRRLITDLHGQSAVAEKLGFFQEKVSVSRTVVGFLGLPVAVRDGYHALLHAENHFLHLTGWKITAEKGGKIRGEEREKQYQKEFFGNQSKACGLAHQICKFFEKTAYFAAYGVSGFCCFLESCQQASVDPTVKAIGQKYNFFCLAYHLFNCLANICEFVRLGFIRPLGDEEDQKKWAQGLKILTLKLSENIFDIIVDVLIISSFVFLGRGYTALCLGLLSASIGLWRLLEVTATTKILPADPWPIFGRA